MKRSLIFCAVALLAVAAANTVHAAADVQLNLRYDDPANEAAGGSFDLLVLSDNANGLAGISVLIDGIDAGPTAAGAADTGFNVFETQTIGTVTEIVTGSDLLSPNTSVGLGVVGSDGGVADDLFPGNSPVWNGSALIASGTFGATRPAFVASSGTLNQGANEFVGGATAATETSMGTMSVRGDGVATDGLLPGDANRDGSVNGNDFSLLALNFNNPDGSWDQGDFVPGAAVDGNDFSALALNFNGSTAAPAIGSVPEPGSLALLGLALASLATVGRRK